MPSLNFTKFVDKVENGSKTQTIRAIRKRPIKVGDTLHLFTGQRHPGCRRLSPPEGVVCTAVNTINIMGDPFSLAIIAVDGRELNSSDTIDLALRDGFDSAGDFRRFFIGEKRETRFHGQLIRWKWWGEPIDAIDPSLWLTGSEADKDRSRSFMVKRMETTV
jgi:hypothetical protein